MTATRRVGTAAAAAAGVGVVSATPAPVDLPPHPQPRPVAAPLGAAPPLPAPAARKTRAPAPRPEPIRDLSQLPERRYFRIGEVAVLLGVKAHVLRYWETEFPQLRPQKSRSNQRLYRRREVELLLEIRGLLYERGFTIVGARKALEEARAGGLGVPSLAPLPTSVPPVLSGPPTEPEPLLAAALSVPPAVSAGPAPEQLALALASSDRAMLEELRHEVQDLLDLCKEG